ncbi:MAG: histidinol-phosphatase HisJ family protein [Clostridia bacterium]|nr:histidinol-phosphatase HisJ family protein [Clostridia bacterium]
MNNAKGIYGCHNHTFYSEDSNGDPARLCAEAVRSGLAGIAITDHFDTEFLARRDQVGYIRRSLETTRRLQRAYAGQLRIFTGVEVGSAVLYPEGIRPLLATEDFDIVIGSVHTVRYPGWILPFSRIDFTPFTEAQIHDFLYQYFIDLQETADTTDFDVLAHLTVPLRYIIGKYRKPVDMNRYQLQVRRILQTIVDKGIALEVNTSGVGGTFDAFMPERDIVQQYLDMGGRAITLASDAHIPENATHGLAEGAAMLRSLGVTEACYYRNRKPVYYPLPDV